LLRTIAANLKTAADTLENALTQYVLEESATTNGRILKANLSWSPTRAKFGQLIVSLSVILT